MIELLQMYEKLLDINRKYKKSINELFLICFNKNMNK